MTDTKQDLKLANLKHLTAQMVLNQREKPTMNATPLDGVIDYAVGGSAMDLATSALDEAIPNGQRLRVQFAAALASEGWMIQLAWLRAKGYNVDNLVTMRPFEKPTEYEAGIFAEALEGCYINVIEDTKCPHCGEETKPTAGLEWNTQALAQLMETCVEAHQSSMPVIGLTPAEVQSGHDRVKWAEGLIRQLPRTHEGRNSWLMNFGEGPADALTYVFTGVEEQTGPEDRATSTLTMAEPEDGTLNDVGERNHFDYNQRAIKLDREYGPEPGQCGVSKTPIGWSCTRAKGHEGPCAAVVIAYDPRSEIEDTARLQWIVEQLSPDQLASIGMFPFTDEKDLEHLRQVTDDARRAQPATRSYRHGELEVQQDSASVDRFAAAIKARMRAKGELGYKGWREADAYDLVNRYHRHSVGGNIIDAGAYLMMCWEKDVENLPLLSPTAMRYRFEDDLLNLTQKAQSALDNGDARHQWVSAMERCRTTFNIGILTSCELRRRTRGWFGRFLAKLQGE